MKATASDETVVNKLEAILKESRGKISPSDAAVATGYPLYQVKDALARLIELYEARVTMNPDNGQVQFIFKYPFFRRGKKTFKENLQSVAEGLWKAFKTVYKASVGVILIAYTLVFVLILIVAMFAGRSNDRDDDNSFGGGYLLSGLLRGIMDAIFYSSLMRRDYDYRYDESGYRYKKYGNEKNKGKGFIQSVFSFVFGPERPEYHPLDDAMEAAAFIRNNNGKLTAGDIVALSGVDYDEAEARLAEYGARFNGELYVNDDGIVVGEFDDMLNKTSDSYSQGKIVFYEDEVEPPYELTGNTSGKNLLIAGMNGFNLMMSLVVINYWNNAPSISFTDEYGRVQQFDGLAVVAGEYGWLVYVLGYFPLVISALFYIIPLFRWLGLKSKQSKREANILRKKLIGAFVRNQGRDLSLNDIYQNPKISPDEKNKIQSMMERLIIDVRGELNVDSDGTPIYSFPRLAKELKMKFLRS